MTVDKLTLPAKENAVQNKINEIIDNLGGGGGGTATDVQINGTSITSNNVANIVTNTAYNASSNKIATMGDVNDTIIANTPIGAIIPFTCSSSYTPDNCLPCDGTQYSKSQFNAFYTNFLANGNLKTCSFAEYTTELNTYGSCAKFALDTTNEVFRVPSIADGTVIQQAKSNAEIGKGYKAGLPNITGSLSDMVRRADGGTMSSGCFIDTDDGVVNKAPGSNGSAISHTATIDFDASNSNTIYGKSSTVQQKAVALRYFVVVANATINQTAMDWSSWATSLSGKANVDLSNINQTAKNTVINTIMPDYANGISYTYTTAHTDQTYTMPNDGVLYYTLSAYNINKYPAYIKVNGYTVNYMGSSGTSTAQVAMGNINVNKNDIITVNSYYTNDYLTKITFFPMKGAA